MAVGHVRLRRLGEELVTVARRSLLVLASAVAGLACQAPEKALESWPLPVADPPGLLHHTVSVVQGDPTSGALWFGTDGGGVSRYDPDSHSWTTFTHADGLASNVVNAIEPEPGGPGLWFATGHGVSRYHLATDTWTTYTQKPDGLISNYVSAIQMEAGGDALWLGTDSGVSRYDLKADRWESFTTPGSTNAIELDPGGQALWFGTDQGARRYEAGVGWRTYTTTDGLAGRIVVAIEVEPGGEALWFGTTAGASRYDLANKTWQRFTADRGLASDEVYAILAEPRANVLWFGTGEGVSRYDLSSKVWRTTLTTADGLAANWVRAIYRDPRSGLLWFGTEGGGVSSYAPTEQDWNTLRYVDGLVSDDVYAIEPDPGGAALWFGTGGSGASRYDLESGLWQGFTSADGLASNHVYAIRVEPGNEALWFGTTGGASRLDLKSNQWQSHQREDGSDEGLAADFVRVIGVEPGKEALWFGTAGGASRLDLAAGRWQNFTTESTDDGLAFDSIEAIGTESTALWFGFGSSGGGVSRYDLETGRWTQFDDNDGLTDDYVFAIESEPGGGALWFGTARGGASRYDLESGRWTTFSIDDNRALSLIQTIVAEPDGRALWFGTGSELSGLSRYDVYNNAWENFSIADGLPGYDVRALRFEPEEKALWVGTWEHGVGRLPFPGRHDATDLGSWITLRPPFRQGPGRLAITGRRVIRTRPAGAVSVDLGEAKPTPRALPNQPLQIAAGPGGRYWVACRLGGVRLIEPDGLEIHLTQSSGLPAMDVHAISPVPGSDGARIWVATAGGAALIRLAGQELRIERTATSQDGLPIGAVDALAAVADGSVFLAYNPRSGKRFFGSDLASSRSGTRVVYLPAEGPPSATIEIVDKVAIRDLALSPRPRGLFPRRRETLWAATSAGLFAARQPRRPGAVLEPVEVSGHTGVPLSALEIGPGRNVWSISDAQGDAAPVVIGYRPGNERAIAVSSSDLAGDDSHRTNGWQPHIVDLAFTADGELVVMAGSRLARGRVQLRSWSGWPSFLGVLLIVLAALVSGLVFFHPQVIALRKHPDQLRLLPPKRVPVAIRQLRRARALGDVLESLGLGTDRLDTIRIMTAPDEPIEHRLPALGELVGATGISKSAIETLSPGLVLLKAQLSYPSPLRDGVTPLVAFEPDDSADVDLARQREQLDQALDKAGHRFENPFILLCRDPDQGREIIPGRRDALVVGDYELRDLLLTASPRQTLSGLLLTRDLLALSPYSTKGPVKDPTMFYGRNRLIRELLNAPSLHMLLVGPRRVGKTSVLRRLAKELREQRDDLDVVGVDLLAQDRFERVARKLGRELAGPRVPDPPAGDEADWLEGLLRRRFAKRQGLLLIDEADNLVELDETRGFPLISTLRSLHSEDVCSVILTGYWHLYRRTLDHSGPLNNLASECRLGPLRPDTATALASQPLKRLGLVWEDEELPKYLAERTGGYPDLIQAVCDLLLEELKRHRSLVLTRAYLERAEDELRARLIRSFRINALGACQLMVDRLLEVEVFTGADAHDALEEASGRDVPLSVRDLLLEQLVLFGFAERSRESYRWTIPLLRETLLGDPDRANRRRRLLDELPKEPAAWLVLRR